MKKTLFLFLIVNVISNYALAQYTITGKVIDIDTGEPISCAYVSLWNDTTDIFTYTDFNGSYSIQVDVNYDFMLAAESFSYQGEIKNVLFDDIDNSQDFHLYAYGSSNNRTKDVALFDILSIGVGMNLYSPPIETNDKEFSSNIELETFFYDFRNKLAKRTQFGVRIVPLKFQWNGLENPSVGYKKEKYFGTFAALSVYVRYVATVQKSIGIAGLFVDVGAGYAIPYYFAMKSVSSADKYKSVSTRHIHKLNEFEAMLRVGYSWCAIKATYRFTDVLKDNYIETPKLRFGIEIFLSPR